jgi:hypothetical protein
MKKISLALVLLSSVLVSGCGEEEIKTSDWWKAHPKEATERYLECKSKGNESLNCQNIKRVKAQIARVYEPMMDISKQEADEYRKANNIN